MDRYQQSETARVNIVVADAAGVGITGMSVSVAVRKHDGKWWNPAGYFQTAFLEIPMTEVDPTNRPGSSSMCLTLSPLTDFYVSFRARVVAGAGTPANGPWFGDAIWGILGGRHGDSSDCQCKHGRDPEAHRRRYHRGAHATGDLLS
jgi:hypothetical protein